VNDSAQAADDPQLRTRIEWLDADQGTVTMKTPVKSAPEMAPPGPAQAIGEDTVAVLAGIGIEPAEIERLAQEGVIQMQEEKVR
jgi:crotonobetainyl-CoA:carnitine CoA-transferase CaiB-like acyl-CoA transferase